MDRQCFIVRVHGKWRLCLDRVKRKVDLGHFWTHIETGSVYVFFHKSVLTKALSQEAVPWNMFTPMTQNRLFMFSFSSDHLVSNWSRLLFLAGPRTCRNYWCARCVADSTGRFRSLRSLLKHIENLSIYIFKISRSNHLPFPINIFPTNNSHHILINQGICCPNTMITMVSRM